MNLRLRTECERMLGMFCLVSLLTVVGCTPEGSGREGRTAPKVPVPNVSELRAKAETGNVEAQVALGRLYAKGEGVTNSYSEAAQWYRRAAEKGNAEAEAALGELYEAGQGVPRDVKMALDYYRRAATNGSPTAQYNLAYIYEGGRGVPQDHKLAALWYQKAAEQGESLAQYDLGQRYVLGVGVPTDPVEGLKWLLIASRQGQADAAQKVTEIKSRLTAEQVREAERRSGAFSPKTGVPTK